MKKQKNIIMIGEEFEENKKMERGYYTDFKTLRECYGRWSDTKEKVYNYYYNLLKDNSDSVMDYGIRSYNCNVIVLHANIKKDNKNLYLVITPSHNWFNEV